MTTHTNRIIGGRAPSTYVGRLASSAETSLEQIERNVAMQVINPTTMVADNYAGFVAARQEALLSLIGSAMGKPAQLD